MAFRWIGKSTNGIVLGNYIVNSWKELYFLLIDKRIIVIGDNGYPDERYTVEKAGLDYSELINKAIAIEEKTGIYDFDSVIDSLNLPTLTDEDYQTIVLTCYENRAYYQDWEYISELQVKVYPSNALVFADGEDVQLTIDLDSCHDFTCDELLKDIEYSIREAFGEVDENSLFKVLRTIENYIDSEV